MKEEESENMWSKARLLLAGERKVIEAPEKAKNGRE